MAFEDIARALGQVATGWQQGTTEREQADRQESQRLIEQSIAHGSRGEDYATFFDPNQDIRPGSRQTLERLQQASGPVGPGVSGEGMLQYPFSARINLQAEREDAARNAAEISQQQHAQDAEASQMRLFQQQQDLALQRQQATQSRRRDTLLPNEWNEMRGAMANFVDDALAPQFPDYFIPNPRGGTMPNPQYADARRRILGEMENRLPMQLPMDLRSLQNIFQNNWNDISPGIATTQRGGGFLGSGFFAAPATLTYNAAAARPRGADTPAPTPGSTAMPPNGAAPTGQPGQVGQTGQPSQAGRSTAPDEAYAERVLRTYQPQIAASASEFNLPPRLIAAVSAAEGGQMVQGPVIPGRAERAFGVMQVLPSTYNQVARELREGRPITDVAANYRVGAAYFARQMRDYNGDVALAAAAYNWGPENLNRMMRRFPDGISRQVLFANMPAETRAYVDKIGRSLGGWDDAATRTALPALGGQGALTTQPQGTPTGNVTQRAPTAQEMGPTNQYIDSVVRSIATQFTSITDITRRIPARDAMLANLPDIVRRNYSPALVDHIVNEVRRQVLRIP